MKLYDSTISGNCYKVRLLLAQLGLDAELVDVDVMQKGGRAAELAANSPQARVPMLVLDDGSSVAESNAILCHLAEGTEFLPSDPPGRARVLQWMFFEQNQHECSLAVMRYWVSIAKRPEALGDALDLLTRKGVAALEAMERHLAAHDWFAAGRYTIADIALYAYTHRAPEGNFDLGPFPAIRAWLDRVAAVPGHVPMFPASS